MTDPDDILASLYDAAVSASSPLGARVGGVSVPGGLPTGTDSIKLFSVVDINCEDTRVCFGHKGSAAFCVCNNWVMTTHLKNKRPFAGSVGTFVFICQSIGVSAYVDPSLAMDRIPTEVWQESSNKRSTMKGWRTKFQAVVNTTDNRTASTDEVKAEASFIEKAELFIQDPSEAKA